MPARLPPSDPVRVRQSSLRLEALVSSGVAIGMTAAVAAGWTYRTALPIRATAGTGYWLGIAGAVMMLLLLAYPARKRLAGVIPGSVGLWFRVHMLLGLLGPLAILYHARFTYDALNSAVAMTAMLIVAGSGVVGRYFHQHLYRGYALRHVEASDLAAEIAAARASVDADAEDSAIDEELARLAARASEIRGSLPRTIIAALALDLTIRRRGPVLRRAILQHIAEVGPSRGWSDKEIRRHKHDAARHLRGYFHAVEQAGTLVVFERLFGLWHHLHLPLFGFLVVTAITHVVAVHLY